MVFLRSSLRMSSGMLAKLASLCEIVLSLPPPSYLLHPPFPPPSPMTESSPSVVQPSEAVEPIELIQPNDTNTYPEVSDSHHDDSVQCDNVPLQCGGDFGDVPEQCGGDDPIFSVAAPPSSSKSVYHGNVVAPPSPRKSKCKRKPSQKSMEAIYFSTVPTKLPGF